MISDKRKDAPVHWIGVVPDVCDLCQQPIRETFVDGATMVGPWRNMDLRCLRMHGRGLGRGLGQMYRRQDDGRWLKVEG